MKLYKIGSLCEECERHELVQYWKGANLSCPNCGIDYPWDEVEERSEWWQQVREHWGNPETLEDYERILREMIHREQVVGIGRKDIMERHAIEDMIQQMTGEEE